MLSWSGQVCHSALPLFVFYIEDDVLSGSRERIKELST
jgi:hypothetical protein